MNLSFKKTTTNIIHIIIGHKLKEKLLTSLCYCNFRWDMTKDHFEDSIEDPTIHECPVGEFPVTYRIVAQGSKRGNKKLIDSDGYTYNIKSQGVNVVY